MDIEQVKEKYLNRVVRHKELSHTYVVYYVYPLGNWSIDRISVCFRMTCQVTIPRRYPHGATIQELEEDYELI